MIYVRAGNGHCTASNFNTLRIGYFEHQVATRQRGHPSHSTVKKPMAHDDDDDDDDDFCCSDLSED